MLQRCFRGYKTDRAGSMLGLCKHHEEPCDSINSRYLLTGQKTIIRVYSRKTMELVSYNSVNHKLHGRYRTEVLSVLPYASQLSCRCGKLYHTYLKLGTIPCESSLLLASRDFQAVQLSKKKSHLCARITRFKSKPDFEILLITSFI